MIKWFALINCSPNPLQFTSVHSLLWLTMHSGPRSTLVNGRLQYTVYSSPVLFMVESTIHYSPLQFTAQFGPESTPIQFTFHIPLCKVESGLSTVPSTAVQWNGPRSKVYSGLSSPRSSLWSSPCHSQLQFTPVQFHSPLLFTGRIHGPLWSTLIQLGPLW